MSVIGYSTSRIVRSRSTTSVSRSSLLTPAARNVGVPALLWPVCALLAAIAGGAVPAARRLPGPGERARAAGGGPHAETGSPERAPAG